MRLCFILYAFLMIVSASAQNNTIFINGRPVVTTKKDLAGAWHCFYSVYENPRMAREGVSSRAFPGPETVVFEGDSVFNFYYPCELVSRGKFSLQGDTLTEKTGMNNNDPRKSLPATDDGSYIVTLVMDTLQLSTFDGNNWIKKKYARTNISEDTLQSLKKMIINPACLGGKWILETAYESNTGKTMINYNYPFALKNELLFDQTTAAQKLVSENENPGSVRLMVPINDIEMPLYLGFSNDNTRLNLLLVKGTRREHVYYVRP